MKNVKFEMRWLLAATTASALMTFLVVGCQTSNPPSNLSMSEGDAQKIQSDRIQKTNQAHQVVLNIRDALSPVEGVLKDLSNISSNVDAKVGGKSIDNLHLSDGFQLIDNMLEKTYRSGLVNSNSDGSWSTTQTIQLNGIIHIGNCDSVQAELSGKHDGDHDSMELNLIECNSTAKILLADVQVNQDTISAGLHLENLKDLSISSSSSTAACALQIGLSGGQLTSNVDCQPIEIQLGSNRIEVSPLSMTADLNNISGKIGVHGYDANGNEFLSVSYPKSNSTTPNPASSAAPTSNDGNSTSSLN
jgi:hypothetical protein